MKAIRGHWGIESNNWILNVTFNGDKVRIKAANQAHIMGRLRGFALQLLRKIDVKNFGYQFKTGQMEGFSNSATSMETMLRQVKRL